MIEERIRRFIEDPSAGDFNRLACDAFAFQFERLQPYRRLCERSGSTPATVRHWQQIPPVPALAYKSLELATRSHGEVFRSSGTSGRRRSLHRHGFLDLYRATIDHSFPQAVLGGETSIATLSLIPGRRQVADSSLSFMADYILERWGNTDSVNAVGERGVEPRLIRSFLAARQRDRQPTLLLSTALALVQLLDALDRFGLRFRLPANSVVFETGGYKGRRSETSSHRLQERLQDRLGLAPDAVVREYGMTELTSQLYSGNRTGRRTDLYWSPHWLRVRILRPEDLTEAPPGTSGLVCILDLANLSSAIHLLTEDIGSSHGGGLRLEGRAAGAELRGCSQTIEELAK